MSTTRQLFLDHLAPTSEFPLMLEIERAEGMYLYDTRGTAYMDLIAGIGVSSLGHRHPAVVAAIIKQTEKYLHTMVYGEYILSPQVELASYLASLLPDNLSTTYFTNSGTEATEGAMKLAKRYTSRYEIIAAKNAYHGSTQGAASLMSDTFFTQAYRPLLPGITHIAYNNWADIEKISTRTAAVFLEVIQAESGITLPETDYLQAIRAKCNETGTLLVFDEIQTGCGRTGTMFAFEQYNTVPDILLLAKGIGGGMPIGAFIASKQIMQVLSKNPLLGHITTFGGHPVSCAAALATLQTIATHKLYDSVKEKEALFRNLLQHPLIKNIRSKGLMMAVELENFETVQGVIEKCLAKGLIIDWFLFNSHSLRIAPPLTITEDEIRAACKKILEAMTATLALHGQNNFER